MYIILLLCKLNTLFDTINSGLEIPTFYQLRNSSWCNLIFCSTMVMSIFYLVNDSHKHVPMAIFSFRDYRLRILNQILKI